MAKKKNFAPDVNELRRVANLLSLVSSESRLDLLLELISGPKGYDALADATAMKRIQITSHLKPARLAGIVESEREGRIVSFSLSKSGRSLVEAVDAFSVRTAP